MSEEVDLVKAIRENPGCIATIDNDMWWLDRAKPESYDQMSDEEKDDWHQRSEIVRSSDPIVRRGSGYGSGNAYGGDILQALAEIVGMHIESV